MSKPTFKLNRGAVRLEWDAPEHVVIEFDYLRTEPRTGELRGQVAIRSSAPGMVGLVHRANLNLTSTQGRSTVVKQLMKRANEQGLDWDALLEEACFLTVEAFRKGEPMRLLRDANQPPEAGWLLSPLVLGQLPTIWFGDGGTAKSYLALAAGISIQTTWELLSIKPSTQLNVAYLDWEFDDWEHKDRMRRLVSADMPAIMYKRCHGPLRNQVDELQRELREHEIGFVIIDSVGAACDGPPEEAQSALGFFDGLRALEVGALCIAHMNRSGDTSRPFGSTFWHNGARATWYMKAQQDAATAAITVGMFNRKSNTGPLANPLGFILSFDKDSTAIERTDVRDVPEFAGQLSIRQRIAREVDQGALSLNELTQRLGEPYDSIQKTVKRGVESKYFARIPGVDGVIRFGLAAPDGQVAGHGVI